MLKSFYDFVNESHSDQGLEDARHLMELGMISAGDYYRKLIELRTDDIKRYATAEFIVTFTTGWLAQNGSRETQDWILREIPRVLPDGFLLDPESVGLDSWERADYEDDLRDGFDPEEIYGTFEVGYPVFGDEDLDARVEEKLDQLYLEIHQMEDMFTEVGMDSNYK
jgi:hypothetical protein